MTDYEKALALWQQKHITTDAQLAEALNGHSIAFAYHSGKLENENITYHDTREIFEHDGVTSYTGDLRTLFEIRNAIEMVLLTVPVLFACIAWLPLDLTPKVVVTLILVVPLGGFGLIGISDDSLTRWLGCWWRWRKHRRLMLYRGEVQSK